MTDPVARWFVQPQAFGRHWGQPKSRRIIGDSRTAERSAKQNAADYVTSKEEGISGTYSATFQGSRRAARPSSDAGHKARRYTMRSVWINSDWIASPTGGGLTASREKGLDDGGAFLRQHSGGYRHAVV